MIGAISGISGRQVGFQVHGNTFGRSGIEHSPRDERRVTSGKGGHREINLARAVRCR